jgi:hypothetical protein
MHGNAVLKHDRTADNVRLQPNTDAHQKDLFLCFHKTLKTPLVWIDSLFTCRWLHFVHCTPAYRVTRTNTQGTVYWAPGVHHKPSPVQSTSKPKTHGYAYRIHRRLAVALFLRIKVSLPALTGGTVVKLRCWECAWFKPLVNSKPWIFTSKLSRSTEP